MEFTVHDRAEVSAPLQRLWVLSRRVELVRATLGMEAVGGVTQGNVEAGSRVIWRGWKFGLPTEHHTLITGFAPPHPAAPGGEIADRGAAFAGQRVAWFEDSQERGRFAAFRHDHWMRERLTPEGKPVTELEDRVHFSLPFGWAGDAVARWVMVPYIQRLVRQRFGRLRHLAEGEGWQQWA